MYVFAQFFLKLLSMIPTPLRKDMVSKKMNFIMACVDNNAEDQELLGRQGTKFSTELVSITRGIQRYDAWNVFNSSLCMQKAKNP